MDLGTVAGDLYGVPPNDFVAERGERAAQARRAGDRELADGIKRLRRPSTGAWLANLLVRERRVQVSDLLAVGAELRRAQARLANEDLRRLSKERRQVVAALVGDALALARDRGQSVSSAAARELEATLEAALLDAGAAGELQAGRLIGALAYTGLGWAGDDAAFPSEEAGGPPVPSTRPDDDRPTRRAEGGRGGHDRLLDARAPFVAAEAAMAEAERDFEERRDRAHEARRERDRQRQQVADLEERVATARAGEQRAEGELSRAEQQLAHAERRALCARDELEKARAGLNLEGR